jgi:signal peptidase
LEPVINVNDLIIVKKPKVNELEEEDIISFYQDTDFDGEDDVVTHYIYDINTNSDGDLVFLTHRYFEEGTPVFIDNWVIGEDDVIGQHAFTIPYVGAVVQFVKSPFGIAAMVVNLGIIVGIIYIMKKSNK